VEANFANTSLHAEDPTSIVVYWPEGNTCLLPGDGEGSGRCGNEGFPEYVVKVGTVRDVQGAVNFAREEGVRLVVKYVFPFSKMRIKLMESEKGVVLMEK